MVLDTFSFICQGTSTRKQRSDFSVFEKAATCYYQSNQLKVEAIPLSALPKDTTSELDGVSLHNPCKVYLYKTRPRLCGVREEMV